MTAAQSQVEFMPVELTLKDGRCVTLRSIREDDGNKLQAAMRGFSDQARYSRFMCALRELTPQMLERATHPDSKSELQLVAVVGDGAHERIVAGARYAAAAGSADCEFAVSVGDEWHRQGLARQLLQTLMQAARARGFARMEGYVLASNSGMLTLAKRLGFAETASEEGPTVRMVRCELR